jgi:hypothetical protein
MNESTEYLSAFVNQDKVNNLVDAIEAVPGALTVDRASTETGWGSPTEATICLIGESRAVQCVVDAFREVARRDFSKVLAAARRPTDPIISPGKMP